MNNYRLENWVPILFSFTTSASPFNGGTMARHILYLFFPNLMFHTICAFDSFVPFTPQPIRKYWLFFQQFLQQITTIRSSILRGSEKAFSLMFLHTFWLLLCSMSVEWPGQRSSRRSRYQYPNYLLLCHLYHQSIPAQNIQVYRTKYAYDSL